MDNFIQITEFCAPEPRLDAFVYRNAGKVYSGAFARTSQRSTMGNKICLSMHPRNFGLTKPSVRTYIQPLMITNVKSHTSYESKAYTICV